jgi:Zn-dependent protease with chaperone function
MLIEGKFYDGLRAEAHDVQIELRVRCGLIIKFVQDETCLTWATQDIAVADKAVFPQPARIIHSGYKDAKLEVEGVDQWKAIENFLNNSPTYRRYKQKKATRYFVTGCILALIATSAVYYAPKLFNNLDVLVPQFAEDFIGKRASKSTTAEYKICSSKVGDEALSLMVKKLVGQDDLPVNITVIDAPEISNAYTFPGGYIVVFSGLVKEAGSAEEVAGVLAHEMAHTKLRHPMSAYMRTVGMASVIEMMFANSGVSNVVLLLSSMKLSREDEESADLLGMDMLSRANIDPEGMIAFFKRGEEEDKALYEQADNIVVSTLISYASTHPRNSKRVGILSALHLQKDRLYEPVLNKKQWLNLKAICE